MPRLTYQIAAPPSKPMLVYDGDCGFCKLWIARWREITAGRIDYEPLQEAAARFPEVPRAEFEHAVKLIEPNGRVFSSADAVFRSLGEGRRFALSQWCYAHVPGFAAITEASYTFIAAHRELAHRVTSLIWGGDVRKPTYFRARNWFLRLLGVVYLIAFLSLRVQVDGLIGAKGIAPLPEYLASAHAQLGARAALVLPTLCWLNSSNAALHFLCGAGAVISVVLIAGIAPILCLVLLFVSYLSLTIAGQEFLSFQWDILLLETGFLAIFLAPWHWRIRPNEPAPLSRLALFLLHFLLFKLMLMSAVVKLTSGDASWWDLTALDYHYWTQPLPTVFAWFADHHPEWFKKFSVAFCLVVEIIVPFFMWAPRRLRLIAAALLIALQIAIAITGNYCFFNLLTIALCLLLIDDNVWRRAGTRTSRFFAQRGSTPQIVPGSQAIAAIIVLLITFPLNLWLCYSAIKPEAKWPRPLAAIYAHIEPFRIANGYGLFRVMTKERPEIQVEGSTDGIDWTPYEFKWKAGAVDRAPRWNAPHQPRLDWQMWFAALGGARQEPWFQSFMLRLLQNQPSVTGLLARNPFPDRPPRYVRAILYKYEFTSSDAHRANGAWWKRREIGEYFPEVTASDFSR